MTIQNDILIPDEGKTRIPKQSAQPASTPEINPDLLAWLKGYAHENKLTRVSLGRRLGYADGSAVSRYMNEKVSGDIEKLEARIKDLKDSAANLHDVAESGVWDTSVLRSTFYFCDYVKSVLEIGVLHGPAGVGKTTALLQYSVENPTSVYISANAAQNDSRGLKSLLWESIPDKRGYSNNSSRWKYLVNYYKGSQRLFLIDNAQRLNNDGRDLIMDFFDETKCPILLAGNPSILTDVAVNEQQDSRAISQHDVAIKKAEFEVIASQLITKHFSQYDVPSLLPYAKQVIARQGYIRALDKELKAASVLIELGACKDPVTAFKTAHSKSTRSYKLHD